MSTGSYKWNCRDCGGSVGGFATQSAAEDAGARHTCPLDNQAIGADEQARIRWELYGKCAYRERMPEGFTDRWCDNPAMDGPYCHEHDQNSKETPVDNIPAAPPASPSDRGGQAEQATATAYRAFEQPTNGDAMNTATEVNTNEDARQAFTAMKSAAAEASDAIAALEVAKAKMAAAANGTADGMSGKRFDSTATQAAVEAADAISLADLGNWSEKVDAVVEAADRGSAALDKWRDAEDMVAQHDIDGSTLEPVR